MKKLLPDRKILSMVMLLMLLAVSTASAASSQRVSVTLNKATFYQLFDEIRKQTGLRFVYSTDLPGMPGSVTVSAQNQQPEQIIAAALQGTGLTFEVENGVVMVTQQPQTQQPPVNQVRQRAVTGTVVGSNGQPMPGVSVMVPGTTSGVTTDAQGRFAIIMPNNAEPYLEFSFIGMATRRLHIENAGPYRVQLSEATHTAEGVVVTGYQEIDKRALTSAVTSMKMDEIAIPGVNSIDKMLEGNVPGMIYMQNTGQVGAAPKLRVRGSSSILGSQEPLWVVDGIIVQEKVNVDPASLNDLDFVNLLGNAISGLNPADIEQIDVLKDASATALYGARAANGVIVITTKKGEVGAPQLSYSMSGTFTPRVRYGNSGINMMNSKDRVGVSRELMERGVRYQGYYPGVQDWIGYERAYLDYYQANTIDFNEFRRLSQYYETMNTDWLGLLMRDTFSHNHTASLNGGSQNIRYYASLGLADEQGTVRNEKNDRYTANLKTNLNYNRITAEFSVNANMSKKRYNPDALKVTDYAYSMSRALPLYGEDGELWFYNRWMGSNFSPPFNIKNEMDNSSWDIDQHSVTFNGQANYKITDELSLRGVASYQFGYTDDQTWFGENTWQVMSQNDPYTNDVNNPKRNYGIPFGGQLFQKTTKSSAYTFRLQADWHKYFGKKHFVSAMAGYELSSSRYDGMSHEQRGYFKNRGQSFDDRTIATNGPNYNFLSYEKYYAWLIGNHPTYENTLTNMMSVYATASYMFDNRYIFNINARSDWSNAFGSRSKEKFFPVWSVSGRWNVSDESWLKSVQWVDMLALRASYGIQGNMLGNQPSRVIINRQPGGASGEDAATIVSVANPDLRWEKTHSYNVGMDFTLFGDKVRGAFSYYYKRTKDAFLTRRVASQNGYTEYVVNAGDIENRGVELALSFTPIDRGVTNGKRNFTWRIDPQIGQAVNQLINKAINRSNDYLQDELKFSDLLEGSAVMPGTALNTFYSFNYAGLDANGRPTFYGLEAERADELNAWYAQLGADDKRNVWSSLVSKSGTRVPVLQGSIRNFFGWRNWGLSVNMTYSLGAKVRLFNLASGAYSGVRPMPHQNVKEDFVDRWQHAGDEAHTDIPGLATEFVRDGVAPERIIAGYGWWYNQTWAPDEIRNGSTGINKYGMYDMSNLRVVSGNYLRLQSATLSYTLSEQTTQKLGIARANFAFTAQNLFTIASKKLNGQNPDQFGGTGTTNIPLRPQYTISLNLNF